LVVVALKEDGMAKGPEIALMAKEQLVALTGQEPDTLASLRKDEDGWHVTVVLVEMRRIPEANDVLGTYEAVLDDDGNLLSYQRTSRYHRGEVLAKEE
jgi:hypothetical protein